MLLERQHYTLESVFRTLYERNEYIWSRDSKYPELFNSSRHIQYRRGGKPLCQHFLSQFTTMIRAIHQNFIMIIINATYLYSYIVHCNCFLMCTKFYTYIIVLCVAFFTNFNLLIMTTQRFISFISFIIATCSRSQKHITYSQIYY